MQETSERYYNYNDSYLAASNNQNSNRRWQNSNSFQSQIRERETMPQNQGNL